MKSRQKTEDKNDRLASALRANLKRRKMATRKLSKAKQGGQTNSSE